MRAALLGSGGPVLGREYPLDADLITIGRRDENTIVIKDPTVSRRHAEIRRSGDGFLVVDKNSTSGVLLNGEPISGEQCLRDGDRLGIGMSAVFLVQLQPVEEATVTFSQPQFGDRERTQFVTRTELDDPRGIVADPPPPVANVAPPPAPSHEAPPRETPPQEAPAFTPPPSPQPQREAPPVAAAPAAPAAPNFSFPPAGASTPPPTHSAAPPPPFSAAPVVPQYTPPPYTPSYAPQAEQGGASRPAQQSSASAVAPPAKSRRGLVIGLVLLLLIIVIVLAIVGFVLVRR